MKFLYVFRKEDRDILIATGYNLLKSDESKDMYVFENCEKAKFDLNKTLDHAVLSNILTF